jgi:hypothetical protein
MRTDNRVLVLAYCAARECDDQADQGIRGRSSVVHARKVLAVRAQRAFRSQAETRCGCRSGSSAQSETVAADEACSFRLMSPLAR